MFILGILIQHGATHHIWIFNVQCSFSMGYLTPAIFFDPETNHIFTPATNKNEWINSVIFKPQPKIQLTRSSYKVMSFLDFQPFLRGFQSVDKYLKDLILDIDNPTYFQRLVSPFDNVQITPLSNETAIWKFLNSPACKVHPYACQSKMNLEQYWLEIQYILQVFHAIYKKFLTAIDHIDYHPSQQQNTMRIKRSEIYSLYGHYHTQS